MLFAAPVEVLLPRPQRTAQPHSNTKIRLLCRLVSVVPALRRPTTAELMPGLNILLQSVTTPILLEPKVGILYASPPRLSPRLRWRTHRLAASLRTLLPESGRKCWRRQCMRNTPYRGR